MKLKKKLDKINIGCIEHCGGYLIACMTQKVRQLIVF